MQDNVLPTRDATPALMDWRWPDAELVGGLAELDERVTAVSWASDPLAIVIRRESRLLLRLGLIVAFRHLDESDRQILIDRGIQRLDYADIAAKYGLTESAARQRVRRARKRLRGHFNKTVVPIIIFFVALAMALTALRLPSDQFVRPIPVFPRSQPDSGLFFTPSTLEACERYSDYRARARSQSVGVGATPDIPERIASTAPTSGLSLRVAPFIWDGTGYGQYVVTVVITNEGPRGSEAPTTFRLHEVLVWLLTGDSYIVGFAIQYRQPVTTVSLAPGEAFHAKVALPVTACELPLIQKVLPAVNSYRVKASLRWSLTNPRYTEDSFEWMSAILPVGTRTLSPDVLLPRLAFGDCSSQGDRSIVRDLFANTYPDLAISLVPNDRYVTAGQPLRLTAYLTNTARHAIGLAARNDGIIEVMLDPARAASRLWPEETAALQVSVPVTTCSRSPISPGVYELELGGKVTGEPGGRVFIPSPTARLSRFTPTGHDGVVLSPQLSFVVILPKPKSNT